MKTSPPPQYGERGSPGCCTDFSVGPCTISRGCSIYQALKTGEMTRLAESPADPRITVRFRTLSTTLTLLSLGCHRLFDLLRHRTKLRFLLICKVFVVARSLLGCESTDQFRNHHPDCLFSEILDEAFNLNLRYTSEVKKKPFRWLFYF